MDLDPARDCTALPFTSSLAALPAQGAKQLISSSEWGYLCARVTGSTNKIPWAAPCKQDAPRDVCCPPIGNCYHRHLWSERNHPPANPEPSTTTTIPPLPMLSQTMRINLCKYRRLIKWLRRVPALFRVLSVVLKARQRGKFKKTK